MHELSSHATTAPTDSIKSIMGIKDFEGISQVSKIDTSKKGLELRGDAMEKMIFYAPFPVREGGSSASKNRPFQMREAFARAGYDVFDLTGTGRQRKARFKKLKKAIYKGDKFAFAYLENANIPMLLSEPKHFPFRPFLDYSILDFLKKENIPLGIFYRDIYWKTDLYLEAVGPLISKVLRKLFSRDLKKYTFSSKIIYLPSMQMTNELPELSNSRVEELPPGASRVESFLPEKELSLLYIGGSGNHYQFDQIVLAAIDTGTKLSICTPESDWQDNKLKNLVAFAPNIQVFHKNSSQLEELYDLANICLIAVRPTKYWTFAVPVKLFEYAGHGKPIIASKGTKASEIVEQKSIGWAVPDDREAYKLLLQKLSMHPDLVTKASESAKEFAKGQTWEQRAKKVAEQLMA